MWCDSYTGYLCGCIYNKTESIHFIILQLLHIAPMHPRSIPNKLPIFLRLPIELLIFPLPPFLIRFPMVHALIIAVLVQQVSLLSPKVVEDAFVGCQLEVFVLFVLGYF